MLAMNCDVLSERTAIYDKKQERTFGHILRSPRVVGAEMTLSLPACQEELLSEVLDLLELREDVGIGRLLLY